MIPDARYTVHMEMARRQYKYHPKVERAEEDDPQRARAVREILQRRRISFGGKP